MRPLFLVTLAFAALVACAMESADMPESASAPLDGGPGPTPTTSTALDAGTPPVDATANDVRDSGPEPATFAPPSGTGACAGLCVTLATSTPGATIYYTFDGTEPTTSSSIYTGPFAAGSPVVETLTVAPGFAKGTRSTAIYRFACGVVPPVLMTPSSSVVHGPLTVRLSSLRPNSVICYTTDGSDPACSGNSCWQDACGVFPPGCPDSGVNTATCTAGITYDDDAGALVTPVPDGGIVSLIAVECPAAHGNQSERALAIYSTDP